MFLIKNTEDDTYVKTIGTKIRWGKLPKNTCEYTDDREHALKWSSMKLASEFMAIAQLNPENHIIVTSYK